MAVRCRASNAWRGAGGILRWPPAAVAEGGKVPSLGFASGGAAAYADNPFDATMSTGPTQAQLADAYGSVPQVIIREYQREVLKPELIERIIEVQERTVVGPPQVHYQEQPVEVPQVVVEEGVVHVPKREVQERLIEVEFVGRIEYEDFVEYREVPVDMTEAEALEKGAQAYYVPTMEDFAEKRAADGKSLTEKVTAKADMGVAFEAHEEGKARSSWRPCSASTPSTRLATGCCSTSTYARRPAPARSMRSGAPRPSSAGDFALLQTRARGFLRRTGQ